MISAVVHVYNEEKNIARCLSSLYWVDEIVLVDMGSTDGTVARAKEFKAKVFQHPYTGFVEPARNFGLEQAKGEWILVVDADEEIPKTLADILLTKKTNTSVNFYRLPRRNIIFGSWVKHSGWWPDHQIRFFKKGAVSWNEKIHGVPFTKGKGEDIEASEHTSINHYNYQTIEQFISRLNRYTNISAKELFLSKQKFSFHCLFEMPAKEFINRYFVWKGYKDGIHGLALSLLQAFSELVIYLKLWELEDFKEEKVALGKVEKLLVNEFKLKQYWLITEELNESHTFVGKIEKKVKRKLHMYG